MKTTKFVKMALLLAALPVLFSSCATIVSGGSPRVLIEGNITEPVTITTSKQIYTDVTLPVLVEVKRHKLDGQRIYVQSQTTRYRDVVLEKSTNPWAFGNIILGGVAGWLIDLSTNCVSKPAQTHFYISSSDVLSTTSEQ